MSYEPIKNQFDHDLDGRLSDGEKVAMMDYMRRLGEEDEDDPESEVDDWIYDEDGDENDMDFLFDKPKKKSKSQPAYKKEPQKQTPKTNPGNDEEIPVFPGKRQRILYRIKDTIVRIIVMALISLVAIPFFVLGYGMGEEGYPEATVVLYIIGVLPVLLGYWYARYMM